MKPVAIVFARVPRLGAVKRRLAREVGDRAALRFHATTLDRLLRRLARDRRFRTVAALTPSGARMRLPAGVMRIDQERGDLGQRMAAAFARFPHQCVALLGSDIPDAGPDDVAAALRACAARGAAFGPAEDGGYWLVAMAPSRPDRPFAGVRWSSPHALADTVANFRRHPALLRLLADVDTAADLRMLQAAGEKRSRRRDASSAASAPSSTIGSRIM